MDLEILDPGDLNLGYGLSPDGESFQCLYCGRVFEQGEVFKIGERFFEAKKAVQIHADQAHDKLSLLLESKYSHLTEHQQQLLRLFRQGLGDKEIAKKLEVSPSTIRHQRFTFREKAKQAKLYLAIYEEAMTVKSEDRLVKMHEGATQVDERYHITESERAQVLKTTLESLEPLRIKVFPRKEKRKIILLTEIAKQFELAKKYPEAELNQLLKAIYGDFVTIRRYLIEYGFLERTDDCKLYWLKG